MGLLIFYSSEVKEQRTMVCRRIWDVTDFHTGFFFLGKKEE